MRYGLARLQRIAQAHIKRVDENGGTWGDCTECSWTWPCPTYRWATDASLDVLDPWDTDLFSGRNDDAYEA